MESTVQQGAGKAHHMPGWLWLDPFVEGGLVSSIRADSIVAIQPMWDGPRDVCTGTLVHLASGTTFESTAMPHEVEDALKEALQ